MMNEDRFKELEVLDNKGYTVLVRDTKTGKLYVKKYVNSSLKDIYLKLKTSRNIHIPRIEMVLEDMNRNGEIFCLVYEEFVAGITFEQLMKQRTISESEALDYTVQLCQALSEIHQMGIIHRDIKPSNVMISDNGNVKLIDFGIARTIKAEVKEDTSLLGTRGYAAPEQYGFGQSEEFTDIYAVGVFMNVLLTGELPSIGQYQGACRNIIVKCINLNPKERFQNVRELENQVNLLKSKIQGRKRLPKYHIAFLLVFTIIVCATASVWVIRNKSIEDINTIYVTNDAKKNARNVFYKERFPFKVQYSDEFEVVGETETNTMYSVNVMNKELFLSVWIRAIRVNDGYETGEEIYNYLKQPLQLSDMVYYQDIKTKGAAISSSPNEYFSTFYGGNFVQCIMNEIAYTRDGYLIHIRAEVPVGIYADYKTALTNLRDSLEENERYEDKGWATSSDAMEKSIENESSWKEESTSDPSVRFGGTLETVNIDEYTEVTLPDYEEVDLSGDD